MSENDRPTAENPRQPLTPPAKLSEDEMAAHIFDPSPSDRLRGCELHLENLSIQQALLHVIHLANSGGATLESCGANVHLIPDEVVVVVGMIHRRMSAEQVRISEQAMKLRILVSKIESGEVTYRPRPESGDTQAPGVPL